MASYNLYIADGSTTTYAYTFDQLDSSSVEVRLNNVIVTTGYTIDTVAKTVTFVGAPDAGTSIMLRRLTSVLLRYRFGQGAAFTGQNLDADFDQLLYAFQEYSDLTDYARGRTLRVPDSDPEIALIPSVAERAGKYLG
ncbi:phage tail fiber protein, partial [Cutibacterium acnes]